MLNFTEKATRRQLDFPLTLTVLTPHDNQPRGVGGWTHNTNGISGNHSEFVAFICSQPSDSILAVMDISQIGLEPAAVPLTFLNVVTSYLTASIAFRRIPFQSNGVAGYINVIWLARWV